MRKVTALAPVLCAVALVVVTGCGGNGLTGPTSSSSSPSSVTAGSGTALASLSHYNDPTATGTGGNPAISCPSDAPRIFHGGVLEKRLELQWQPLYNIHRYEVEVEYFTPGNHWVPFTSATFVDEVLAEIYGNSYGRYRERVRSAEPSCPGPGSWSDWVYLTIDSADAPAPFVPGPPVEETTLTYWIRVTGGDQAANSNCVNSGGGQTGTYLGSGICQIDTPPGSSVQPPQAGQWQPYDGPLP